MATFSAIPFLPHPLLSLSLTDTPKLSLSSLSFAPGPLCLLPLPKPNKIAAERFLPNLTTLSLLSHKVKSPEMPQGWWKSETRILLRICGKGTLPE